MAVLLRLLRGIPRPARLARALAGLLFVAAPLAAQAGDSPAARPASASGGPSAAARFDAAVAAHRAGDYSTAEALWRSLLDEPLSREDRARVLYDLGNTAWRTGTQRGRHEAVAWYTACIRLAPRHADAWRSLELARSELGLEPADRGDLAATLQRLVSAFTPRESLVLSLGALALLAALLAVEALRGGRRWRWLSGLALVLFLLASAPLVWNRLHADGDPVMVVAESGVTLRSEPKPDLPALEHAPPGEVLERIDELPGWTRVETSAGRRGWLPATDVQALAP